MKQMCVFTRRTTNANWMNILNELFSSVCGTLRTLVCVFVIYVFLCLRMVKSFGERPVNDRSGIVCLIYNRLSSSGVVRFGWIRWARVWFLVNVNLQAPDINMFERFYNNDEHASCIGLCIRSNMNWFPPTCVLMLNKTNGNWYYILNADV